MTISANFPNVQPSLLLDFANAKQLPPQVTFTRATTAAYYDGSTTALAEQNLLLYSQTFNTAFWTRNAVTVTNNAVTAPDGTNTGNTMTEDNQLNVHYVQPTGGLTAVAGGTYTLTVYAKANSRTWCYLEIYDSGNYQAYFNLSAGTIGTVFSGITASITSVGSGWYRCQVTRTVSGTSIAPNFGLASADNTRNYTGDGTSNAYFWGSQFEQRSTASAYTATTTQAITNYIPVLLTAGGGQPRFDHNPTTSESLGLLIEEQRTNIISSSEAFQNWGPADFTVTSNTIVGPGGTLTGDKLIANSTNSYHYIGQTFATVASSVYSCSVYLKQGENRYANILVNNSGGFAAIGVDMQAGTIVTNSVGVSQASGTIQSVGNGWYRATLIVTAASTTVEFRITASNSNNTTWTFAGDGFSGFYVWGAQAELGSFPTSYIPTTSASATRAADFASMTGVNFTRWFNNGEGTFYSEVSFPAPAYNSSNTYHFEVSDGTSSNRLIGYTGSAQAQMFVSNGGATQVGILSTSPPAINTSYRCAFLYEVNNFALSVNAQTPVTDTSGTVPSVKQLNIAANYAASEPLNGWMKKLAYYPQAVTSAQLQALTS
jgi:hypothetical protein